MYNQTDSGWEGYWKCKRKDVEGRAKLNGQADYCFKIQGKYILKKRRRTCDNYIKKSSVKH